MASHISTVQQVFSTVLGREGFIWLDPPAPQQWLRILPPSAGGEVAGITNVLNLAATAKGSSLRVWAETNQNDQVIWLWLLK
jgi:hypothetical protein